MDAVLGKRCSRTMRAVKGRVEGDGREVGGSDGGNYWSQCRTKNDVRSGTEEEGKRGRVM